MIPNVDLIADEVRRIPAAEAADCMRILLFIQLYLPV